MSNTGKSLKVKLQFEAKKSLLKLKSKTGSISFPQLGKHSDLNIVCCSDATYASLKDGSLWSGFTFFVALTSETLAFSEAADFGVLITSMLKNRQWVSGRNFKVIKSCERLTSES